MKKNNFTGETVIDFTKLPDDSSQIKFDIDFDNENEEEEENLNKTNTSNNDEDDGDDFELDLGETEEEDSEEEQPEKSKKPSKKEETQDTTSKEEQAKKVRNSKAQERIRELANKNREILQNSLAQEKRARELEEEIIALKKRTSDSDLVTAEKALEQAKYSYAKAFEDNDPVAIAEANAKLSQASMQLEFAKLKKTQAANLAYDEEGFNKRAQQVVQELQTQEQMQHEEVDEVPEIDIESQNWLKRNKFIFATPEIAQTAGALFEQLEEDGYDKTSFETFQELEERLTAIYPSLEKMFKRKIKGQETKQEVKKPAEAPRVANANRTQATTEATNQLRVDSKGKIKYKPTKDDVDMAKRMGIDIKSYVKSKLKQERSEASGSKYTEIF